MGLRILFACNQVPNYGGANTTFYMLFEILQREGWDVHYLNIIENDRLEFYRSTFGNVFGNPKYLPNVHNILFNDGISHHQVRKLIDSINPDLFVGKNFKAPFMLKTLKSEIETWFLPSGCSQIRNGIYKGILRSEIDALKRARHYRNSIPLTWAPEIQAVEKADKIICHTGSTRFWFNYFYPEHKHKISENILWSAPLVYERLSKEKSDLKNFKNRSIDVLFVANRWSRDEKNYDMVKKIIRSCKGS